MSRYENNNKDFKLKTKPQLPIIELLGLQTWNTMLIKAFQ